MTEEISRAGIFSLLRDFKKKIGEIEGLRIIRIEHIWRVRDGPIRTSLVSWLNHSLSCRKYREVFSWIFWISHGFPVHHLIDVSKILRGIMVLIDLFPMRGSFPSGYSMLANLRVVPFLDRRVIVRKERFPLSLRLVEIC